MVKNKEKKTFLHKMALKHWNEMIEKAANVQRNL